MTDYENKMAEQWGPLAQFSEYPRGADVKYRGADGQECVGTIIWIVAAGEPSVRSGKPFPLTYIIEREGAGNSFPDIVYQSQIEDLHGPQEPYIRR